MFDYSFFWLQFEEVFNRLSTFFANNEIIGLDIGYESVKMVEVSHDARPKLSTFGIAKHELDLDGYWDGKTLRQLSKVIHKVLNNGNFEGVKTVMSVRSKDVYVTTMDFPADYKKSQIQKEINSQAKYILPYAPNEMRLSWSFVEKLTEEGKRRVVINALPEFVIQNSKNLLEHTNLDGLALENQTLSQVRSLVAGSQDDMILVDIGSSHTVFSIVVDGALRSTTYMDIGSDKVSEEIANHLAVEKEIGEYFKRDLSYVNLEEIPRHLLDYIEIIKHELDTYINLNKRIGQNPTKIVATGGGVYTAGMLSALKSYGLPVEIGNPIFGLSIAEDMVPFISPALSQLSTSIGLAKRVM